MIKLLTRYYGKAIRSNTGDCAAMQDTVWAVFYHSQSTNSSPQHQYCLSGQQSWCKFNRALANSKHSPPTHPPSIQKLFLLSKRSLSDSLTLYFGATQNQNESFNSTIWQRCPKTEFCSANGGDCYQFSSNLLQLGPGSLHQTPGKVGGHCFSPHVAVPFWQGPSQGVCIKQRRRWREDRLYT